jgi:hypothetical protein
MIVFSEGHAADACDSDGGVRPRLFDPDSDNNSMDEAAERCG